MKLEFDISKLRTEHFTIAELCASDTAKARRINNAPDEEVVNNLFALMYNVLEPARRVFGKAMIITSGFRCNILNTLVGGSKTSQHTKGQAADIVTKDQNDLRQLFAILADTNFDQLLFESNSKGAQWIHISYVSPEKNRHYLNNNYKA